MGQRWTPEEKAFQEAIHEILLREWDPIGVQDEPAVEDEYETYEGIIRGKLRQGADARELARYLGEVETVEMSLGGGGFIRAIARARRIRRVARRLAELLVPKPNGSVR